MQAAPAEPPVFKLPPRDPRLADRLKDYPSDIFGERLYQSIELMERYSIELAIDLVRRLGVLGHLDDWRTSSELCQILGFRPRFCLALEWLLERLVETDCIDVRRAGGDRLYRLQQSPGMPDLRRFRQMTLNVDRANEPTLDLLDHAATVYPTIARGELTAEQVLFDPKGIDLWLGYFHNDNPTYAVNNWAAALVATEHVSSLPRLRILEVGAGAGSGSEILLQCLGKQQLLTSIERYSVTEPNAFFRRRAQRGLTSRFKDVPFEFTTLDLNHPWPAQIAPPHEFDLIYAVNVFHVSKDLLFSLKQAASMLREGGWLVIGECLRPRSNQPIYPELMFQNLDSFNDVQTDPDIRPRPGFLTPEQWRIAFERSEFAETAIAPDIEKIREFYPHFFTGAICGQKA